jgi:hypothetical protein
MQFGSVTIHPVVHFKAEMLHPIIHFIVSSCTFCVDFVHFIIHFKLRIIHFKLRIIHFKTYQESWFIHLNIHLIADLKCIGTPMSRTKSG